MFLSTVRLKELLGLLDRARQASTGSGLGSYCDESRHNADGTDYVWQPKPLSQRPTGYRYPDGSVLEVMPDGRRGVKVSLGVHGRAYLGIDPISGTVCCVACSMKTVTDSLDTTEPGKSPEAPSIEASAEGT